MRRHMGANAAVMQARMTMVVSGADRNGSKVIGFVIR